MKLPEDVLRWVDAHFSDADKLPALTALTALRRASTPTGEAAGVRLLRCAVLSSRGDLRRLEERVQHMRVDWRDVILAAEYRLSGRALDGSSDYERVYDFNRAIEEAAVPPKR